VSGPEIYSAAYYDRLATLEDRHWWSVGMRAIGGALLRNELRGPRPRVLDAGCGTGAGARWARTRLGAATVVGVDVSSAALRLFRARAGVPALQADVLDLPFRATVFDLVVCHDLLQHLPTDVRDRRALAELRRVLRPGGLLLVRSNSRLGTGRPPPGVQGGDYRRFTLPELVARIRDAGFDVSRATYANALPALPAAARRWWRRRRSGSTDHRLDHGLEMRDTAAAHPWLNRLFLGILRAEAWYLTGRGRRLPFGHSTFCVAIRPVDAPPHVTREPGR
jgi:SAM-dependent methyltransferase